MGESTSWKIEPLLKYSDSESSTATNLEPSTASKLNNDSFQASQEHSSPT